MSLFPIEDAKNLLIKNSILRPKKERMEVKVFTWNVLSGSYFDAESYPTYDPEFFDIDRKHEQVLDIIQNVMDRGYIIILYEVCDGLRPSLIKLACSMKYVVRDSYCNNPSSGNMGIAIMWPDEYTLHSYDQFVVGHYIEATPEEEKQKPKSCWRWFWNKPKEWTILEKARWKKNMMIFATLSHRNDETKKFIITGYHMPCAFNEPKIMKYHIETVWMLCRMYEDPQRYIGPLTKGKWSDEDVDILTGPLREEEEMIPYIISIDMNQNPDSDLYKYMESRNMVSAHKKKAAEPEFTTNVIGKSTPDGFKETIDYVWVTEKLIQSVKSTMPTQFTRLLPNDKFPSDHYWMKFTLQFK